MRVKIVGIFVCMLFIGVTCSSAVNVEIISDEKRGDLQENSTSMMHSSSLVSTDSQNSQTDESQESSKSLGLRNKVYRRVWTSGLATSCIKLSPLGRICIIRFTYVKFSRLNYFPPRWEIADVMSSNVLLFGINQNIPLLRPFIFRREWIPLAIVLN
jgi:hypothetical protein